MFRIYEEVQEVSNCKSFSEDKCKNRFKPQFTTFFSQFTTLSKCHICFFFNFWFWALNPSHNNIGQVTMQTLIVFGSIFQNLKFQEILAAWENKSLDNCPLHGLPLYFAACPPQMPIYPRLVICAIGPRYLCLFIIFIWERFDKSFWGLVFYIWYNIIYIYLSLLFGKGLKKVFRTLFLYMI